jgi:dipeptidyl aminopeptidase/acylaminoacyl peptidase
VLDGVGDLRDASPVNQESSRVQAVVALAAPTDFSSHLSGAVASFLEVYISPILGNEMQRQEIALIAAASPVTHVSSDDPPVLLIHGEVDPVVPFNHSFLFGQKLKEGGVIVEVVKVAGGDHGLSSPDGVSASDYFVRMVGWFDRHLRGIR